jgi:predicted  nucleic acid-binding Zn-ribbon protein
VPVELYYDASRVDTERARTVARAAVAAETLMQNLQSELAALKKELAAKDATCAQLQRQHAQLQNERAASNRTGAAVMVSVHVQCMNTSMLSICTHR